MTEQLGEIMREVVKLGNLAEIEEAAILLRLEMAGAGPEDIPHQGRRVPYPSTERLLKTVPVSFPDASNAQRDIDGVPTLGTQVKF